MKQGSILKFFQKEVTTLARIQERSENINTGETCPAGPSLDDTYHKTEEITSNGNIVSRAHACSSNINLAPARLGDPRATISRVHSLHLARLKSITSTLLPVRYSDKFYSECLEPEKNCVIAFVAMYDSKVVGWIRCRIEPLPNQEADHQIYIQVLGVLAPFRGLGLATELLRHIKDADRTSDANVKRIHAHVWEKNDDALMWYEKRGFSRVLLQPQYYRRLNPSGAWIVHKDIS